MDPEIPSSGGDGPLTQSLHAWRDVNVQDAGRVIEAAYAELRVMASRLLNSESRNTLQPTALVHELYLRLGTGRPPEWKDRAHFFAVAANTLRRILIDRARTNLATRRGGGTITVPLQAVETGVSCSYDDLLFLDQALTALEESDPRAARVMELRFFGGLEEKEIAEQLAVSEITVKRDWKFARAWLALHLKKAPGV